MAAFVKTFTNTLPSIQARAIRVITLLCIPASLLCAVLAVGCSSTTSSTPDHGQASEPIRTRLLLLKIQKALETNDVKQAWLLHEQWEAEEGPSADTCLLKAQLLSRMRADVAVQEETRKALLLFPESDKRAELLLLKAEAHTVVMEYPAAWHAYWIAMNLKSGGNLDSSSQQEAWRTLALTLAPHAEYHAAAIAELTASNEIVKKGEGLTPEELTERIRIATEHGADAVALHAAAMLLSMTEGVDNTIRAQTQQAATESLKRADELAGKASLAWREGRFPAAADLTRQALSIQPELPAALAVQWKAVSRQGDLASSIKALRQFWRTDATDLYIPEDQASDQAIAAGDWPLLFSLAEQALIIAPLRTDALDQRCMAAWAMGLDHYVKWPEPHPQIDSSLEGILSRSIDLWNMRWNVRYSNAIKSDHAKNRFEYWHENAWREKKNTEGEVGFSFVLTYQTPKGNEKEISLCLKPIFEKMHGSKRELYQRYREWLFNNDEASLKHLLETEGEEGLAALLAGQANILKDKELERKLLHRGLEDSSTSLPMRLFVYRSISTQATPRGLPPARSTTPILIQDLKDYDARALPGQRVALGMPEDQRETLKSGRYAPQTLPSSACVRLVNTIKGRKVSLNAGTQRPRLLELTDFEFTVFQQKNKTSEYSEQVWLVNDCKVNGYSLDVDTLFIANHSEGRLHDRIQVSGSGKLVMRGKGVSAENGLFIKDNGQAFFEDIHLNRIQLDGPDCRVNARQVAVYDIESTLFAINGASISSSGFIPLSMRSGIKTATQGDAPPPSFHANSPREPVSSKTASLPLERIPTLYYQGEAGTRFLLSDGSFVTATDRVNLRPGQIIEGQTTGTKLTSHTDFGDFPNLLRVKGPSGQATVVRNLEIDASGSPIPSGKQAAAIEVENAVLILDHVQQADNEKVRQAGSTGALAYLHVKHGGKVLIKNSTIHGKIVAEPGCEVFLSNVAGTQIVFEGGGRLFVDPANPVNDPVQVIGTFTNYFGPSGKVAFVEPKPDPDELARSRRTNSTLDDITDIDWPYFNTHAPKEPRTTKTVEVPVKEVAYRYAAGTLVRLSAGEHHSIYPSKNIKVTPGVVIQGNKEATEPKTTFDIIADPNKGYWGGIGVFGPSYKVAMISDVVLNLKQEDTHTWARGKGREVSAAIEVNDAYAILRNIRQINENGNKQAAQEGDLVFLHVKNGGKVLLENNLIHGKVIADPGCEVYLSKDNGAHFTFEGGGRIIVDPLFPPHQRVVVSGKGSLYAGPEKLVRYIGGAGDSAEKKRERNAAWAIASSTLESSWSRAKTTDERIAAVKTFSDAVFAAHKKSDLLDTDVDPYLLNALLPKFQSNREEAPYLYYASENRITSSYLMSHLEEMPHGWLIKNRFRAYRIAEVLSNNDTDKIAIYKRLAMLHPKSAGFEAFAQAIRNGKNPQIALSIGEAAELAERKASQAAAAARAEAEERRRADEAWNASLQYREPTRAGWQGGWSGSASAGGSGNSSWNDYKNNAEAQRKAAQAQQRERDMKNKIFKDKSFYQ